jgi:hypothetical protein
MAFCILEGALRGECINRKCRCFYQPSEEPKEPEKPGQEAVEYSRLVAREIYNEILRGNKEDRE